MENEKDTVFENEDLISLRNRLNTKDCNEILQLLDDLINENLISLQDWLSTKDPFEILLELDNIIEEVGEDDFDAELVKVYQAVLEEKAPLGNKKKNDAVQSFRELREKYAILYDAAVFGVFDFSYAPLPKRILLKILSGICPSCVLKIEGKNMALWCKEEYEK